jgi:hypothetical protein
MRLMKPEADGESTMKAADRRRPTRLVWAAAAAFAAAAAYMVFEAQWVKCRKADLPVPASPPRVGDSPSSTFRTFTPGSSPRTSGLSGRRSDGAKLSVPTWCFSPATWWGSAGTAGAASLSSPA